MDKTLVEDHYNDNIIKLAIHLICLPILLVFRYRCGKDYIPPFQVTAFYVLMLCFGSIFFLKQQDYPLLYPEAEILSLLAIVYAGIISFKGIFYFIDWWKKDGQADDTHSSGKSIIALLMPDAWMTTRICVEPMLVAVIGISLAITQSMWILCIILSTTATLMLLKEILLQLNRKKMRQTVKNAGDTLNTFESPSTDTSAPIYAPSNRPLRNNK